ncbi:hypothetical protein T12_11877 [Trichinella patagoniensis]|uniref:Zonadhesin n=1 Tax=Trichinella patagoniensis TaxID=990121 RepID=A0A0V0ZLD5_9BILA|nr:hypothetical protein T12_11877 [Trichinella patagoniensis]
MLLTAILVVIVLALIYHFVTEKKQILEWKETRVQRIPEKKTPEEIIKESKELQLKADKKQVEKTKKKTKSKKSKKAFKSIPKGTDISKEKTETDKKIEMAESSPETIPAVATTRNVIPQIVSNVATEKKAAERIGKEESRKEKKKSKTKSKSKKSKKTVQDTVANKAVCSQIPEADITSPKLTLATEVTAIDVHQPNIVPPISEETIEKSVIKDEPKFEKKDFKKSKKRSKKRTKSKKSKKIVKDTVTEKAASSQMPKMDSISPKLTLANEVTAIDLDQLHMVPPIADENVEKPVIKDKPKGDKKHSKKIKKKSKKRSKSKKSNKPVEDKIAK